MPKKINRSEPRPPNEPRELEQKRKPEEGHKKGAVAEEAEIPTEKIDFGEKGDVVSGKVRPIEVLEDEEQTREAIRGLRAKGLMGGERAGLLPRGLPPPSSVTGKGKKYSALVVDSSKQHLMPDIMRAGWHYAGALEKKMIFSQSPSERDLILQALKEGSLKLE